MTQEPKPRTDRTNDARITTRAPSTARISVDSRRHSETSKILELVGRQPGFLSTLALIPSVPTADCNQHTAATENQSHPDKVITDTAQRVSDHQTNSNPNTESSEVEKVDKSELEIRFTDNRISTPNFDTDWSALSADIYRDHWPLNPSDSIPGNITSTNTGFQEASQSTILYDDSRNTNLRVKDSASPIQLSEKTAVGSSELKLGDLTNDRQRRNTSGVVTFDLPDDEGESLSTEESQEELEPEQDFHQGQTTVPEDHSKMSAPELPPIGVSGLNAGKGGNCSVGKTPREHKRKTSNHSNHSSGKVLGKVVSPPLFAPMFN